MEQYYRKTYIPPLPITKPTIKFKVIEWWDTDLEDENGEKTYTIYCSGTTTEGNVVILKITHFCPYYYIKIDNDTQKQQIIELIKTGYVSKKFNNPLQEYACTVVQAKDIWNFSGDTTFKFLKLVFNQKQAMMSSRYLFKQPIRNKKFALYESNVEPFMRFCHIQNIQMANWIEVEGSVSSLSDTGALMLETKWTKVKGVADIAVSNILQASWDIETYSYNGSFPDPQNIQNEIFQIATVYKYSATSDGVFLKTMFTTKPTLPIEGVYLQIFKDEKELIKRWVHMIKYMDPDVIYTYNGDNFDFRYIYERCKLLGIENYLLDNLSRIPDIKCIMKKEFFQSSAYGDNDYFRLYIPLRLNYDLLIYYKRGMKKYDSYKLDSIANQVLNVGKHDVEVVDIFNAFSKNDINLTTRVAKYCVQDTMLLQQLVDKQKILLNIIQLANVTYVPIGYLNTRGQTIKVFSQLLRKAREMNYMVPHTNFNADTVSYIIKTKTPLLLKESHIGSFIDLQLRYQGSGGGSSWGGGGANKYKKWSGKIMEIIDDNTFTIMMDNECTESFSTFTLQSSLNPQKHLISKFCLNEDIEEASFTGATVLDPIPGMYIDNVAVLDFASLYPTIMISRNLCFSTFVDDPLSHERVPGVVYEQFKWTDIQQKRLRHTCEATIKSGKSQGVVCGKQASYMCDDKYFCKVHDLFKKTRLDKTEGQSEEKHHDYTIVQSVKGVLPTILEELYTERKKVKRLMERAYESGDTLSADIYNSTQMAIKVSLNSCYGFLGRSSGNLARKELGCLVTYIGRQLIDESKAYSEGPFIDYIYDNNLLMYQMRP